MLCLKKPTIDPISDLRSDPVGGKPTAGVKSIQKGFQEKCRQWQEEGMGEKKALNTIFSSLDLQHSPAFLVNLPEALKSGWFFHSY